MNHWVTTYQLWAFVPIFWLLWTVGVLICTMGSLIAIYRAPLQLKAQHLNSTGVHFITLFFASLRLPLLLAHINLCTHTLTQTCILVEDANSLWLGFHWKDHDNQEIWNYQSSILWFILSLSPLDWQRLFNSWHTPVICPINYTHTNLPVSYPLFCFLETVLKKHILYPARLLPFWIYTHFLHPVFTK